jgi:glycosyltransferase involved in cell wall biosynthesis
MNQSPAVSVIVPVYNPGEALRRCLDGLIAQTFKDWEAVCVNDGSTDGAAEILDGYARRDGRFKIISKENTGVSDTRNVGIAHAGGEFVMFHDADDFMHPQSLEILHSLASREPADMVVFRHDKKLYRKLSREIRRGRPITDARPDNLNARYSARKIRFKKTDDALSHATERSHGLARWMIRHCYACMFFLRSDFVRDIKFIRDVAIAEDFPWLSEILLRRPKTVITDLPLYYYIPGPLSALNSAKAMRTADSLSRAMSYIYRVYKEKATKREMEIWSRELLWQYVIWGFSDVMKITDPKDIETARDIYIKLRAAGVFDNPPTWRARKYRRRIDGFIENM